MVFGNGVKNIQAAAYNGARTVYKTKSRGCQSIHENLKILVSRYLKALFCGVPIKCQILRKMWGIFWNFLIIGVPIKNSLKSSIIRFKCTCTLKTYYEKQVS